MNKRFKVGDMVETIFPQPFTGEIIEIIKEKRTLIYTIRIDDEFYLETNSANMKHILPGRVSDN